jgi:glycosyltransferase involved in cell wall biosynthesis
MKILQIIGEFEMGGAELLVLDLCVALSREDEILLYVLGEEKEGDFQRSARERLIAAGVGLRFLWKRRKRDRLRTVLKLRRLIAAERPQLIATHLEYVGVIAALAGWGAGIPQVHSIHGEEIESMSRLRFLAQRSAGFIAVSESVRARYVRALPLLATRILAIPSGVDLVAFPYAPREGGTPLRFINVGRLDAAKDQLSLVAAAAILKRGGSADFRVLILGEGPMRGALERLVAEEGLGDIVSIPGASSLVARRLEEAEVYVSSSRTEGLSIALIEAAVSGLPLIATEVGGSAEVVKEGVNGFLVPSRDPTALSTAMRRMIEDPSLVSRLGASQTGLRESFSIESSARAYAKVYRALAKQGGRRGE